MKKPIKIYLADLAHNYFPADAVVPLNIANIAAYIDNIFGADIKVKLFKFPNVLLDALKKERPDILGLSNYFWNSDLNLQIGKFIKNRYPGTIIVMGGPSINLEDCGVRSFLEKNSFLDAYIMLEGERHFVNLLNAAMVEKRGGLFKNGNGIEGCAYLLNGDLVYPPVSPPVDLNTLPSPYLRGYLDEFLKMKLTPLFETNRGCPYTCTYCAWGVAYQKQLRQFPLERVFRELEYVARFNPDIPYWWFTDSNFGIFERDVKIARKIGRIKKMAPNLRIVNISSSKNNVKRNLAIAKLMNKCERQLIAVQTLDPYVEGCIKRVNIKKNDIRVMVKDLKRSGGEVVTDILCGLPGETKSSHLATIRKCFDLGFDALNVANVYLLPGSEMYTDESRKKFKIIGKYRLKQGYFGVYRGIKTIESEEVVRQTSTMTEKEILEFRLIHWLIWYAWNSNFLKPLMLFLKSEYHIHPFDFIMSIIEADKSKFPQVNDLFVRFRLDARQEWFDNPEELKKFYLQPARFTNLLRAGFPKMNFGYTAEFVLNPSLYQEFCDFILNGLGLPAALAGSDIFLLTKKILISAEGIHSKKALLKKTARVQRRHAQFIIKNYPAPKSRNSRDIEVILYKKKEDINFVKSLFQRYSYARNKKFAVEKTLENSVTAFSYDIAVYNG